MNLKAEIIHSNPSSRQAAVFYLGQETILIKISGKYIIFDPYLTDYVDRNFSDDNITWKRNYPAPIAPEELDFIDYVFCSHAHGDHTDPETLAALSHASSKAVFIGGSSVCNVFRKQCGIPDERIIPAVADKEIILCDDIRALPIPSAHEELHPDGQGSYEELGFVLKSENIRFYHAGDCCMYDGLTERIQGVDMAFMPINGRDYFRLKKDIIGNFDSIEAIRLAVEANISLIVPMHFDLYDVNCVNPAYFVDCLKNISPSQRFHIFAPGEKYIFEK